MTAKKDYAPVAELSFKEGSVELEQIVRSLETGELELEESLETYNRGVELLKELRSRLDEAELKVNVLMDSAENSSEAPDTTAAPASAFLEE